MTLTRRTAILAILSTPLAYYRTLEARGGWLTLDLNQWSGMTVKLGKQKVDITAADIMAALQED